LVSCGFHALSILGGVEESVEVIRISTNVV
jgi:hypothetical protein